MYHSHHHIYEGTRCKILAGARLGFISIFLQQPFIQVAQPFFSGREPVEFINILDDFFQIGRFINTGRRIFIDGIDFRVRCLLGIAQVQQHLFIESLEFQPLFGFELIPAILHGDSFFLALFLAHFKKQNIRKFRDIVLIGNAIVTKDITFIPQTLYDFLIGHNMILLMTSTISSVLSLKIRCIPL